MEEMIGERDPKIDRASLQDEIYLDDDLGNISPGKTKWKWILIGSAGFVFVFLMSFFFAAVYVQKKEAILKHHPKAQKVIFNPVIEKKERPVIKRYDLSPFFIRMKNPKTGGDSFLSAQVYIEFVSREIPSEIKAKRELLRTLIYKQLKKHFTNPKQTPAIENRFKSELVSALNIFFEGGGVYTVGLKEFVVR